MLSCMLKSSSSNKEQQEFFQMNPKSNPFLKNLSLQGKNKTKNQDFQTHLYVPGLSTNCWQL